MEKTRGQCHRARKGNLFEFKSLDQSNLAISQGDLERGLIIHLTPKREVSFLYKPKESLKQCRSEQS